MTIIIKGEQVKALRQRTGAGIMDCKRALQASCGDLELAIEELRKSGRAKASKKAGRSAHEGRISIAIDQQHAALVEVNSETDFVAHTDEFIQFADDVAKTALACQPTNLSVLEAQVLYGSALMVEVARQELIAKLGENIEIRRMVLSHPDAMLVGTYVHRHRIGVLVELEILDKELAKNLTLSQQAQVVPLEEEVLKAIAVYKELARNIAMHVAASNPQVIDREHMSAKIIEKEKEIYFAQALASGKPKEVIEKMVQGRLENFLNEATLVGQAFAKEPEITVGHLLSKHRAKVTAFYRIEVGESAEDDDTSSVPIKTEQDRGHSE